MLYTSKPNTFMLIYRQIDDYVYRNSKTRWCLVYELRCVTWNVIVIWNLQVASPQGHCGGGLFDEVLTGVKRSTWGRSAVDGAMFDIQILAHLVNGVSRSQCYLGCSHLPDSSLSTLGQYSLAGIWLNCTTYFKIAPPAYSGWYIIAACVFTSVIGIWLSFRSVVNCFRVTFSTDVSA